MAGWDFYWIDPDGGSTQLGQIATSKVLEFSGLGHAPLEHFLQAIPSQHVQLHRGLKFRPRVVQLIVVDRQADADAQDARQTALLAAFNPDRGEGTLKIVMSDGSTERGLDCYVQEGPDFPSSGRPRAAADQIYMVRFVAPDPFLYDPTQDSESDNFDEATPVDIAVNNVGHIGSYPVITVAGPVNNPKLTLVTTDEFIQFSYNLTAGHHLDIDCAEGTVTLDDALMNPLKLTKASTLFYIPRGAQHVKLTATSGTGLVTVTWYSRFLGI